MVKGRPSGTTLLILLVIISFLTVALLVALPVWTTEIQREREEELVFRGGQYVEAIRLFQKKNPGTFPRDLKELLKQRCLRRLYPDPMTKDGRWNILLDLGGAAGPVEPPSRRRAGQPDRGGGASVRQILVVPEASLAAIGNPRVIGVASASPQKSFRVFEENETYDTWLFYYGRDPSQKPEVIRFGQPAKRP